MDSNHRDARTGTDRTGVGRRRLFLAMLAVCGTVTGVCRRDWPSGGCGGPDCRFWTPTCQQRTVPPQQLTGKNRDPRYTIQSGGSKPRTGIPGKHCVWHTAGAMLTLPVWRDPGTCRPNRRYWLRRHTSLYRRRPNRSSRFHQPPEPLHR